MFEPTLKVAADFLQNITSFPYLVYIFVYITFKQVQLFLFM